MSRTQMDAPKIPNMTAMQPTPVKPLGIEPRIETGGQPTSQAKAVDTAAILGGPNGVVANAVTGHNAELEAKHRYYKVTRSGSYKRRGSPEKHAMYEGKILDTANYDIREVKSQGIRLQEVDENGDDLPTQPAK